MGSTPTTPIFHVMNKSIIDIISHSHLEIFNHWIEKYPSVFYLGLGKCGSQSLCAGFVKNKVAHWHSERHFKNTYGLDISPLSLLDIVNYVSETKPVLIIECIREPVSRAISILFQEFYTNRKNPKLSSDIEYIKNWVTDYLNNGYEPYAKNWISYYDTDILKEPISTEKYIYKHIENKNIKLLFLRYEDSKYRKNVIQNLGYIFTDKYLNITSNRSSFKDNYLDIRKKIKFPIEHLQQWFNNPYIQIFYTLSEINHYIKQYAN